LTATDISTVSSTASSEMISKMLPFFNHLFLFYHIFELIIIQTKKLTLSRKYTSRYQNYFTNNISF